MGTQGYQKTEERVAIGNSHISLIILNVNTLNSPMKRYKVAGCIKKQNQLYPVFRRHILAAKTNIDTKGRGKK